MANPCCDTPRSAHARSQACVLLQNSFVFSGDDIKDIEINFGMHKNIIEGLEAAGSKLQHVYFNSGGKWYGKALSANPCLF